MIKIFMNFYDFCEKYHKKSMMRPQQDRKGSAVFLSNVPKMLDSLPKWGAARCFWDGNMI